MYRYLFYFNVGRYEVYASSEDDAHEKLYEHLEETIGTNEHYGHDLVNLVAEFIDLEETNDPELTVDGKLTLEERNK